MKKIRILTLVVLCLSIALSSFACVPSETGPINVAAIKGPTGMGMVALMEDNYADSYHVELSAAPDDIVGKFVSGEVDIAAVPVNLASVLYNKTDGDAAVIAVNTLGVLYVLENGNTVNEIADLSGKTLYATVKGATTEYILDYILEKNGLSQSVTVEYLTEHSERATMFAAGEVDLAMLPEPNVTAVKMKGGAVRTALDMTEEWNKVSDTKLVQGCIIVRSDFLEKNEALVKKFLEDYEASVALVNRETDKAASLIEKHAIMSSAAAAKVAIPNCNIVCITGAEMKAAMKDMLTMLFEANPKSIGGAIPKDDFYY